MASRSARARRYIVLRVWPVLVGIGSASVMLLAFVIPGIQDQWDRFRSRNVVEQYVRLGDSFYHEDNFAMAEAAYDKAIELSESKRLDIEVQRLQARVSRMAEVTYWGDTIPSDISAVDFEFLLHLRHGDPNERGRVLGAYGIFLAGKEDTMKAVRVFNEALRLRPLDPMIRLNYANLLDQMGLSRDAGAAYLMATRLEPASPEAHYDLGSWYAAEGRKHEAEDQFRTCVRLDSTDTASQQRIADLERALMP